MNPPVRYQIFVSSTYEDLRVERQQATQAILETGCFPAGMELFPASDDTQWELIKRVIQESDYYIVIIGGKYGSLAPGGNSYTEMEYDYAIEKEIPVLGFVKADLDNIPSKFVEPDPKIKKQLDAFRDKVMTRTCRKFKEPSELGMAVMKSVMSEIRTRPRTGWVRADYARTEADRQRELKLEEVADKALKEIEALERELRDRSLLPDEASRDQLAQGDDKFSFTVLFRDTSKMLITETVPLTYDQIFAAIGPPMYGYIQRKTNQWNRSPAYEFERCIIDMIRAKIIARCQNREIKVLESEVDACVFQFKELGYLMFENNEDGETTFRGITLTEAGELYLSRLKTVRRSA
jgi:hypothetical protein